MKPFLLSLENISKTYHRPDGSPVNAVRNVSLTVQAGETITLVGESGSGKSTLGKIALGLEQPDSGHVFLNGKCINEMPPSELRRLRISMQPIFQDASASLNPRRTVRELLAQSLRLFQQDHEKRGIELLNQVGLRPGAQYLVRFPHELSGGQRQRLAIARAIAMQPKLIIADEPLSGSDVSIRGEILNLLIDIKRNLNTSYLMITHDISIARAFGDRAAVMRLGEIVEVGSAESVFSNPQHSYTQQLVAAVPSLNLHRMKWTTRRHSQCSLQKEKYNEN
jgi:ABC-type oligopeptide transport system ATPase subunit